MSRYDIEKQKWNEKLEKAGLSADQLRQPNETFESIFSQKNHLRPIVDFFAGSDDKAKSVLDFGAGDGWTSILLARKFGSVNAFDISEKRVEAIKMRGQVNEVDNLVAECADAEHLPYEEETFDIVFGHAIIHHLQFDQAISEISRVLKPGGKAAFCEPFAHNPIINLGRYIKHHYIEDHVGTDQPLVYSDRAIFEKYFSKVEFVESSFFAGRIPALSWLDGALPKIPLIKRLSAYVTILLEK